MSRKKVMQFVEPHSGKMKCKVCGYQVYANCRPGGGVHRGSWQCPRGCKLPDRSLETEDLVPLLNKEVEIWAERFEKFSAPKNFVYRS